MSVLSLSRVSFLCSLTVAGAMVFQTAAQAQSTSGGASGGNGGWFVPKAPRAEPAARRAAPSRRVAEPAEPAMESGAAPQSQTPPVLPLPPVPTPPPIGKEAAPPAAVIGIINVQGVMQLSTAAQEIQQTLGARRDRLARAVQREEASWRTEQQKLQSEARKLTSDQIQLRERHLQQRRAKDQRDFGNQARIIQEAAQVAFHQVERELEQPNGIIAQVAGAHGMNLILHGEQVVLHVGGQDITEEVAERLNKILPHVFIPGDGVDPEVLAKSGKMPTTADEERLMHQAAPPVEAASPAKPESVLRQHH